MRFLSPEISQDDDGVESPRPETCARTGADRRTDFAAKAHRDSPAGTWSGPFPLVCFHTAKEILRARAPKKRNEAVSLLGELQYTTTLTKNAVAKLNMGVGVTKKAPTYAPEIGVMFRF